jgi:cold shock CspA family protein
MRGTVTEIIIDRGFGFIREDSGQQFFFHRNALQGGTSFEDLGAGTAVEFEVGHESGDESGERPRAVNVRLAPDAVPAADHEILPPQKTR